MSKEAAASNEAYKIYEKWESTAGREAAAQIATDAYRRIMAGAK